MVISGTFLVPTHVSICISLEVVWSMTMIPMRVGGAAVVGAGDANVEAGILGFIIHGALMP